MIAIIAQATCREALRSRSFLGLLAIFAVATALARVVGWVSGTEPHTVTASVVFSLQALIGVLVAVATGTALVHVEVQQHTLYTVLTRPMPRWHFVVGKFMGLVLALAIGQLAMLLIGLGYLAVTGAPISRFMWLAGLLIVGEVWVMAAVALAWTTLTSPLLAAVLSLATYACGHAVASLPELMHTLKGTQYLIAVSLASLVPNLGMFTYRERAIYAEPPLSGEWLAAPYGAAWIVLLLLITVAVFRRKQL